MDLNKIRNLILNDNVSEAFTFLQELATGDMENDVFLLHSQFNSWEKNFHLNIGAPVEEKNRIIYATLNIISQIESKSQKGPKAKKLQTLAEVELDLAKGYEKLVSLRNNGAIDLFMTWMLNRQPETFQKLLDEEKKYGQLTQFSVVLSKLNLAQFASEYKLNVPHERISDYLLHKEKEIPMFFTGWTEYSDYRERFAMDLTKEIEKYKKRHQSILKTGTIGAILGAVTFNLFERSMDKVIDLYESGMIDSESSNLDYDDDDDDD